MSKEIEYYLTAKNAHWYVYLEDRNGHNIEKFNVFYNWKFREACERLLRKNISKDEFAEEIRHEIMYCFWSKCEYEIIITSWPRYEEYDEKIDVADQIFMNYLAFIDYIWIYLRPIARRMKNTPTPNKKLIHTDWRGFQ